MKETDRILFELGFVPLVFLCSFLPLPQEESAESALKNEIKVVSCLDREVLDLLENTLAPKELAVDFVHASQDAVVQSRMKSLQTSERPHILFGVSTVVLSTLADWGLLEPYAPPWGKELAVGLADRDRRWYGLFGDPITIVYNREYYMGDKDLLKLLPEGWEDLGRPRFKDQIILENPTALNATGYFLACVIDRAEQLYDNSNKGFDLLREIDANILRVHSDQARLMEHLFSGERGSVTITTVSAYDRYIVENMPADLIIPEEGFFLYPRGIALVKEAPGRAREVYDALTDVDVLDRLNRERGGYSLILEKTFEYSVWPGDRHSFDFFPTNHDSVRRNIAAWVGEYQNLVRGKAREKVERIDDAVNTVMMFLIPLVLVLLILTSRTTRWRKKAPK